MTGQLREILAINAAYRSHFSMPIKQMYYGALHLEAKIMCHYAQMSNPSMSEYIEHQQRGIFAIQRISFLKDHNDFERMCSKEINDDENDSTALIDVFKWRMARYMIIDYLFHSLRSDMKKINNAPHEMPNHPSCHIITQKQTLNTEKLILHIAYINYEDIEYFKKCYGKIYTCSCF